MLKFIRTYIIRPEPIMVLAVLGAAISIALYVHSTMIEIREGLPGEVLEQQRDISYVVRDLAELVRALEVVELRPSETHRSAALEAARATAKNLRYVRQTYNFDNLVGASAMHAIANPALQDIERWLTEGLPNLPSDSPLVLRLSHTRARVTFQRVEELFSRANETAVELIANEQLRLERFRISMFLYLTVFALFATGVVVLFINQRNTEARLSLERKRLSDSIESINEGFALFDRDDRLIVSNHRYSDLYPSLRDRTLTATSCADLAPLIYANHDSVEAPAAANAAELIASVHHGGDSFETRTPDGRWVRVSEHSTAELGRVQIHAEITEQKRVERELIEEKERAQVTLDSIGDGVITTDVNGIVEYMNPVGETLTGWTQAEARGELLSGIFRVIDEESGKLVPNPVTRCLREGRVIGLSDQSLLISRCGQRFAIQDSAAPIRDAAGEVSGIVLTFNDVTETRRMAQQMAHQATHDPLTGLVNRRDFERRLEHARRSAASHGLQHALCYLDLDRFKIVNDTAGHAAGDELLKQVAEILRGQIRGRDTLARVGGDEFSLLLENCELEKATEIGRSLMDSIREFRFLWEGRTFEIGVSIGIVPTDKNDESVVELLSKADIACYTAKDLGRNRIHVYQPKDSQTARRHIEIRRAADLSDALNEERFRLYSQPICPLKSALGDRQHFELLLRLLDNDGKIVLPGAFIPAAERYGLMPAVDRWTIGTAFGLYHHSFPGNGAASIAINLSGSTLNDDTLLDFVKQQLKQSCIPPGRICFEITETAAISNLTRATRFIAAMKGLGCRFALDDFGSGLSSFTYLKNLPVDYLKIDGSFVRDMVEDPIDHAMVAAINEVGHIMGIQTIAEFACTESVVGELRKLGVDYAQGHALGYPCPIEKIDATKSPSASLSSTVDAG
jgi:diguanylate cyclase (GGDEF)-like protein/PAS domain S-box-containing protein